MTWRGVRVLWSHWRRNPWQLLTLLVGISLSTALWSGVQAINAEARASYAAASDTLSAQNVMRVTRADNRDLTVADYVRLRRAGVPVSPVLEGRLKVGDRVFQIIGIDPLNFPGALPTELALGGSLSAAVAGSGLALVHAEDVERLQDLGLELVVDDTLTRGTVVLDIAEADRRLDAQGGISHLLSASSNLSEFKNVMEEFQVAREESQADLVRLTRSFHLNLTAFGFLSFAVGIFIVYGAVGLAFEQRRGVFRTLRALGIPLRRLMALLVIELGTFAVTAGLAGVALGYVIAAALLPDVAATLRGLYGADVAGQLQLRASWWVSGLAMALFGTSIAAAAALYKLAHMPVLSFNHPRAMSLGSAVAGRRLAVAALVLVLAGVGVSLATDGLVAGFALLGALMLGASFVLPWVLDRLLAWAEHGTRDHALLRWFCADSRQQLPGLSMALMALMLAMAANIGVSTMVSSFRITFASYLDQRLPAELYLSRQDAAQSARIADFLKGRVDALLPITSADARVGGLPVDVFGVIDHATFRDNWPLLRALPAVWDRLSASDGVLVNEQLARKQGFAPGDELPTGDLVLGVYSDYGNPSGQVIMGLDMFQARYPDAEIVGYGIRTSEPDSTAAALRQEFRLTEEELVNQQDLKSYSLFVFERTFAVTGALSVLTLTVAALAIFISLLTLATMRLPQLAPVWALGLTRRHLAGLELLRALCLASLTVLVSVPVGLLLAWVLLAVVNVEAFGWRLPMYVFPVDYTRLALLTLLAAFAAALWPAMRLARTDAQSLLRVFTNER